MLKAFFTLFLLLSSILLFGQPSIITGPMPSKICINDTTQKTLSYSATEGYFIENGFIIKVLKVNQVDSSVISYDYVIPDSVKNNLIYFRLDSLLDINEVENGVRYLSKVVALPFEGTYSNFFDIISKPKIPNVVEDIELCQDSTPEALLPNSSAYFRWYLSRTNGIPLVTAPIPNTSALANQIYYVSEFNACGESERGTVNVTIKPKATRSPAITSSKTTIFWGEEITLTANTSCVAQDSLRWSNFKSGSSIKFAPDTTYTYYAFCKHDKCESPISNQITINVVNNQYCAPFTELSSTYGIGTAAINLNGIPLASNTQFKNYRVYQSSNTKLVKNNPYNFVIQFPQKYFANTQHLAVWLDFNRNNVFDPNEIVYQSSTPINGGTNVNFSITLPNTTSVGLTRLRVRTRPDYDGQVSSPCANYNSSETEDYIITIDNPCPDDLILSSPNADISSGSQTINAKGTIQATNKIAGNGTTVILSAGKVIELKSGFSAEKGGVFITRIEGCL